MTTESQEASREQHKPEGLQFSLRKSLQGEIKNVTDPYAAAAFNSYECVKGALWRRSSQCGVFRQR